MKRPRLFKQLIAIAFLISGFDLSAQGIITEHIQQSFENPLMIKHRFDEMNYDTLAYNGVRNVFISNKLFNENHHISPLKTLNEATLEINLDFDPAEYNSNFLLIYNDAGYMNYAFWEGTNPITMDVPEGTYDIFAEFTTASGKMSYIIKELVTASGDTSVDIEVAEAYNYISVRMLNESGEMLEPGIPNPEADIFSSMCLDRSFFFLPSNIGIYGSNYLLDGPLEGDSPYWDFYINDVSDRYLVTQSIFGTGFEQGSYFTKFILNGIEGSTLLENNPENLVYHEEQFQLSPLGDPQNVAVGFSTQTTLLDEIDMGGWTVTNLPGDTFKGYLDNPIDGSFCNLLVFPALIDHQELMGPNWEEPFFIKGNAIVSSDGKILYGSGNSALSYFFLGNDYYYTETGKALLPFHPKFTFTSETTPDIKQGDNSPIVVNASFVIPNESNFISALYKGQYGEMRESDFSTVQIEVKHDGEILFSGDYLDFLIDFILLPTNGIIEITFTNTNIEIENLDGTNITKLTYNADAADEPPTLQMLQFRNSEEKVTHIFDNAENGWLRLAAADFKYTVTNNGREYYAYNAGNTVEFYYSLYNQDSWTELELTEYPEHFFMPAFGDYYEASLANVVVTEENSWFDVKIICTDAAGNKQEQVVSPAFKIGEINLGIEETDKSGFVVYPNPFSVELNIQLPENVNGNYTFKVTDLSGKTVYSQNRNADSAKSFTWNGSYLPKGVYICSIVSNGKTIAKKVIKK